MTSIPRGAELLRQVMDSRLLDVHTAMVCEVRAFDAVAQTVDAQPMVRNVIRDHEGGELEESYPLLRNVPVRYPRCGKYIMVFPLVVGDMVTVHFCEWSIDQYIEKGVETHPVDLERHGFSGAIAVPGGPYPASSPVTETIDALLVGVDGGALVKIADDGSITLAATGATSQPIALGDDVKTQLDNLADDINALKTAISGWAPVPNDGGAALKAALAAWYGAALTTTEVGSSKVKAQI